MKSTHFGQFGVEHLKKMRLGIVLYNQEKFWECHEELEDPWMEDRGDNARNVYWTIIQVATALLHYLTENQAGATGMLNKAKKKIERCEKLRVETPIMEMCLSWSRFKSLVRAIPDESELRDFDELYQFKFSDPQQWDQHLN